LTPAAVLAALPACFLETIPMIRQRLLVAAIAALGAVCATSPSVVSAQEAKAPAPAGAPDLAHAQQIVQQVCAGCHGGEGTSPTPANPNLAGQPADYITEQLAHFKAGVRQNPIMQPMAAPLSDADMRALGAFFSQKQARPSTAQDAATVAIAQHLWRGGDAAAGVPACASCHGPDGAGVPKNFPRLAGQHAEYTYAQLQAFKSGQRGHSDKDPNGAIMATIASRLTDAQMKALADYAQGLR
jgi:cytochrome c553